jgi:hypothetical protein
MMTWNPLARAPFAKATSRSGVPVRRDDHRLVPDAKLGERVGCVAWFAGRIDCP